MAPQAFVPINRRPKSEGVTAPTPAAPPPAPKPTKPAKKVEAKPAKAKGAKASAFPVLPALAATLVVLGGVQAGMWWWNRSQPAIPAVGATAVAVPVATVAGDSAPQVVSVSAPAVMVAPARPASILNAPALPQNLQFGDPTGRVTITIFSDPSCGACRMRLRELMGGLPNKDVRYVYKFWPSDKARVTPGLLVELARREGGIESFWSAMQAMGPSDLDDTAMLHLMDRAGVPLTAQRKALADHSKIFGDSLEADIVAATAANLPAPPVLLVEDKVMDTASLTPAALSHYVTTLLEDPKSAPAPIGHSPLRQLLPPR